MFRNEKIRELQKIDMAERKIDEELVKIKVSLYTIEKLEGKEKGNSKEFYDLIDNIGIYFYKLKNLTLDKYNKVRDLDA